ncbi:hypothetical protein LDO51_16565 [Providencia alcalifaciens]|uniref:hypothetical protein n=1 Tax=Providencia alcalifaciens TaxID=126385 RepID=UPI001CE07430|nr:hypothetical protein [Providencia alcalifaciens]UBX48739.1 hypothetical protein LDO51_16565 [Providencia alcalifaciens]
MIEFFHPQTTQALSIFYFTLILAYLVIHLIWEHFDKFAEDFSLTRLPQKVAVIYTAATFSSNLFLIVIMFNLDNPLKNDSVMILPLSLAGLTGLCYSLGAIVPRKKIYHT